MSTWELALAGDIESINAIIEKHQGIAYAAAKRRACGSNVIDYEDAAQEALVFVYERLVAGEYAGMTEEQFKAELYYKGRDKAKRALEREYAAKRDAARREAFTDFAVEPEVEYHVSKRDQYIDETLDRVFSQFRCNSKYMRILDMVSRDAVPQVAKSLQMTPNQVHGVLRHIRQAVGS